MTEVRRSNLEKMKQISENKRRNNYSCSSISSRTQIKMNHERKIEDGERILKERIFSKV